MQITISGTERELADFLKNFGNTEAVLKTLIENNALEQKLAFDDPKIAEYFDRIGWATVDLAKVIWKNAGDQSDKNGVYLTVKQLEKLGIQERTASARIGGSRRVCADLEIEDVLSLKVRDEEKRYYFRPSAKSTILQCLEKKENVDGYQEYLAEIGR